MASVIKKIVIIGPESTGKSTLSSDLAAHFGTVSVPEYARSYLEASGGAYEEEDLLTIAKGQLEAEDKAVEQAKYYLFCDTDLNVIKVWSEHKYHQCENRILQEIATRAYDVYLLTDIDFPWQEDPLREHPAPEMRAYFFRVFLDIVQHAGLPFAVISGNPEERVQQAIQFIQQTEKAI